jgi:hypothetical protein
MAGPTDPKGQDEPREAAPEQRDDTRMNQRPRCAYVRPDGSACLSYAVQGSLLCWFHDDRPDSIARRRKARLKGTKNSHPHDGLPDWSDHEIKSIEELRGVLSEILNAGARGDVTTARLQALASVANALAKSIEGSELEKRLVTLEEEVKKWQQKQNRG